MKLLAEISDKTLGIGEPERLSGNYVLRKSARAILLNSNGEAATQYLKTYKFHKLPGGGIDPGESIEEALKREVYEEVGCNSTLDRLLGATIEYRNQHNIIQISYCFAATTDAKEFNPMLEAGEIEEGQITLWIKPKELLTKMKSDIPGKYTGHFILKREISFLEEFLRATI